MTLRLAANDDETRILLLGLLDFLGERRRVALQLSRSSGAVVSPSSSAG
jgi:hypothetical protein